MIVVTGGAGFIGSRLVRRLLNCGEHVHVIDNLYRGSRLPDHPLLRFTQLDIVDRAALASAVSSASVVFHLAAQSNVIGAALHPHRCFESNVIGTYNVLAAAESGGVGRVVFTSSREIYGDASAFLPVEEWNAASPKNAYGTSKAVGEFYCAEARRRGLPVVVLRLSNVYGPGDRDRVIPIFVENAINGDDLVIYGRNKLLDFVWVDDVVDALLAAAVVDPLPAKPLNIGSGVGTTLEQLAADIIKLSCSVSKITHVPARTLEVDQFVASISAAQDVLGYRPRHDFLSGLDETIGVAQQAAHSQLLLRLQSALDRNAVAPQSAAPSFTSVQTESSEPVQKR